MASNHAMVLASASGVARWKSHNAPDFMEKTPHPLKVRLLATRFNGVASKVVYVIPAVCAEIDAPLDHGRGEPLVSRAH